jgi:excisionase family DNA binding protein
MTFPNRLITVKETAELLSISDRKVRDLIARPKANHDYLPSHHIGGKVVLDPAEIKEWLSQR